MITISLNQILAHDPCHDGWYTVKLAKGHLDYDAQWPLVDAIASNDLEDCVWAFQCLPQYTALWTKLAVWAFVQRHPELPDEAVLVLRTAWDYSSGRATMAELMEARTRAWNTAKTTIDTSEWNIYRAAARVASRAMLDHGEWLIHGPGVEALVRECLAEGAWVGEIPEQLV